MFQYHGYLVELEYREYKLPESFPCIALLQGEFSFSPGSSGPLTYLHFHNCVEIGICHAGGKDLYVEDSHERFCTGDISVIPPYTIHISQNRAGQEGEDCEYLYFSPEELLKPFYPNGLPEHLLWYNRNQGCSCVFPMERFRVLYQLIISVFDELRRKRPYYHNTVRGLILAMMVELSRINGLENTVHSFERLRDMTPILPALELIGSNNATFITTAQLADACHLSVAQFGRIFKQIMTQSPADYIRMVKLQKACELLYSTEMSILDIALESGFQSLSAFNRAFLKSYQKSPSKWRQEKCSVRKKNVRYSPYLPSVRSNL